MTLLIDPAGSYVLKSLLSPAGREWVSVPGADAIVTADGARRSFGSRSDGFAFEAASTRRSGARLELEAAFVFEPRRLRVVRHVAVVSGSPTFEVWTTFEALDAPVVVSDINAWHAAVVPGTLHWVTGLQPAPGDRTLDSSFARRQRALAPGETLALGSNGRSSESAVPWIAVDGAGDELYAALMWSSGWSLSVARTTGSLALDWGLAPMATAAGAASVEGPHALVGLARGSLAEASAALRSYIVDGLRGGRPFTPLVTYNTWFAYGTKIDERSIEREMEGAAALGVELFVVDAGWYAGADTHDAEDFEAGLGTWVADPQRFPNGLGVIADYAHALGMKFGVWVEPERVDRSLVGEIGLEESWLATANGSYVSETSAMICLADAAARQWVVDRLTALIDAVHPDYLKWDNNLWVNCNRDGHGHGQSDGSFAHVTALYQILDALRQKYPSLLIENSASGGNRLDLGLVRYTDVAWMDDHTAPSVHVRHNIDGLSLVFPPAYLLSFLIDVGWEPLHDSPDLPLYARSRMQAVLGLCFRSGELEDYDLDAIAAEIELYAQVRPAIAAAAAALLSPQPNAASAPDWDVLEEASDTMILLYAFDSESGAKRTTVFPTGLDPDARYRVVSSDAGPLGEESGATLMSAGIGLRRSAGSAAHLIYLVAQP